MGHLNQELIGDFFDAMGSLMSSSNVKTEQLVVGANNNYVVESQHVWTDWADGPHLDTHWCGLWKFENGRIVEGRHLAGDQHAVDEFFTALMTSL